MPQGVKDRRDDASEEDRAGRAAWKRGSPQRQKAAFWERARSGRKKTTPRNPNPGKRRRKR